MADASELAPGTVLHDTYRILRRVAEGGAGAIYAATHARLAGRYAVKVLHAEAAALEKMMERFRREAEITSSLRHPNIVQIYDFNQTPDGRLYLVMEYLEGVDLRTRLDNEGQLAPGRVRQIVEQVCSALEAAHSRGVTHRDLKPENLFCVAGAGAASAEKELVKVLDFGMSKLRFAAKITADATLVGTPQYMAPEQALGMIDKIDPLSDQFALATIVYEMLSGQPAFHGKDMVSILHAVVRGEPAPLTDPGLAEVDKVLRQALSKDRAKRHQDITAFNQALQAALTGR